MTLTPTDESNLLLPLFEGIFETPVWETFLKRLIQRTGAQRVRLTVRNVAAPDQPPLRRRVVADRWAAKDPGEPEPFDASVYSALRPNRVYSFDEVRGFEAGATRKRQGDVLTASGIGDARLIRVAGRGELNAWLVLLHERPAFGAADSALLASLAPAIAAAVQIFASIGQMRLRLGAAEDSLALLGIGQAVLDSNGRMLVADALGTATLPLDFASAAQHTTVPAELARAAADLAGAVPAERRTAELGDGSQHFAILRPVAHDPAAPPHPAAAIASIRSPRPLDRRAAHEAVAACFGLSAREAALAVLIADGRSIIEAGSELRLTLETARNYSKRIYAKTGAAGQADLVRLVLSGLAPLA